MAEWAQHWETVNGPVITAVYTGFCFSNLDIHKSPCFLLRGYIGNCAASNEVLKDVGRDYSNCGTIGEAGSYKMKWVPFAPLLGSHSRKLLFHILCVEGHSISSLNTSPAFCYCIALWKIVYIYGTQLFRFTVSVQTAIWSKLPYSTMFKLIMLKET